MSASVGRTCNPAQGGPADEQGLGLAGTEHIVAGRLEAARGDRTDQLATGQRHDEGRKERAIRGDDPAYRVERSGPATLRRAPVRNTVLRPRRIFAARRIARPSVR